MIYKLLIMDSQKSLVGLIVVFQILMIILVDITVIPKLIAI